ncbi:NepR family anti-sigma factor [Aureimonas sp. AU4]|uniref:NepR family anti-sigma factor n=1 Tax=Aureimonas sp. AU4 TaxID=1638163 RepID=UPI000B24B3E6|nr:NepR family anti-sigma factor [Aureimonas sp. AU4]
MEDRKNQMEAEVRDAGETMEGSASAAPAGDPAPEGDPSGLGTSSAIGRRLKAYYDDVASEPVPDRFLMLLDALDKAESEPSGKTSPSRNER